ncbi:MBL fold metallo-hydrolase [Alcanivorax sp. JB21]|uniref:MBL fold metallo-hydrolase n=1 Tax=Alcanivorax limicola TaxID=2874102 RepID=UPI001CC067AC|nr:MBL fold metallo-hydrolase [Alcanivorax limicola]MBZ2187880.1 MBL fold metallo-hydrolase [Alcanivorax limicola]
MSGLVPGQVTPLVPGIWRLLALNPGMMTGPGTNTYLLQAGDGLMVLDPGPADSQHVDNIRAAASEIGLPLQAVLVTHTHRDHSPAAEALVAELALRRLGPEAPDDGLQDDAWVPDQILRDGDVVDLGNEKRLRVIATPGHVSNHLCYLHEESGVLFSGDHLIQGSTVVIVPPAGSMRDYLASLEKLQGEPITRLAPGHGDLIEDPQAYIAHTIGHRLRREEKVVRALRLHPDSTASDLVGTVYDDVPVFLHGVATMSLMAHLLKLEEEGLAAQDNERWAMLAS